MAKGGRVLKICGGSPPVVQPLTLLYTNFDGKGTPFGFCLPAIEKWYLFHMPSLELCNPFDCCKCNAFEI